MPAAFLAVDEILRRATRLVRELRVDEAAMQRNLEKYGTFAATERVLMAAVKAGANRQEMHEVIREHSVAAWQALEEDRAGGNPLPDLLSSDRRILAHLPATQVGDLLDATAYVGDAPSRARQLAVTLRQACEAS